MLCKCYYEKQMRVWNPSMYPAMEELKLVGFCNGTKECEMCSCKGN